MYSTESRARRAKSHAGGLRQFSARSAGEAAQWRDAAGSAAAGLL